MPVLLRSSIKFLKKLAKLSSFVLVVFVCLFFLFNYFFPLKVEVPYARLIEDKDGQIIHGYLSQDEKWRFYTELHEISPILKKTILHKEDRWFYYHFGVNPFAVGRAAAKNIWTGRRTSGASTITMQVVRLLEPKPRTYLNKLIETFKAFQLEWNLSKDEILQLYLHLIPYGGNVEGVKAASLFYFGQAPEKLSLAQITTLTIIPNRPTSLSLSKLSSKSEDKIITYRNRWLNRFRKANLFDSTTIKDALLEPLQSKSERLSREAPHFSIFLRNRFPDSLTIKTTLDINTHKKTTQITQNYIQGLKKIGVHNVAVLVVDNKSREVKAYVGSQDFDDEVYAGQVDGVQAFRSPGSTLKPLIYGMAFDEGLLTPKMKVLDVPVDYDGYEPENFDKNFNGQVGVDVALAYSLNIPAVNTLNQIGIKNTINKLIDMHFEQIMANQHNLGLSLALGGCGVSLEEMVGFYAALANQGKWIPLKYTRQKNNQDGNLAKDKQVLSPSAAYMISEILTQIERPDFPSDYQNSKNVPKISWKTGTSYGRRDAWSIGYNANYTIGVWIGNFSGEGTEFLTGAQIATPLLFKLFNAIDYAASNESLMQPKSLKTRWVCSQTGKVPAPFCDNKIKDFYIPTISKGDICTHLKKVFVSANQENKVSFCSYCLPSDSTRSYKKVYYPNLPTSLLNYYQSKEVPIKVIPPHNLDCTHIFEDKDAPRISSLINERVYFVEDDSTELLLQAQTPPDVNQIFWYINDKFYDEAAPQERLFFIPEKGRVKISCTDNKGRNTNIWIRVRTY